MKNSVFTHLKMGQIVRNATCNRSSQDLRNAFREYKDWPGYRDACMRDFLLVSEPLVTPSGKYCVAMTLGAKGRESGNSFVGKLLAVFFSPDDNIEVKFET